MRGSLRWPRAGGETLREAPCKTLWAVPEATSVASDETKLALCTLAAEEAIQNLCGVLSRRGRRCEHFMKRDTSVVVQDQGGGVSLLSWQLCAPALVCICWPGPPLTSTSE